MSVLDRAIIKAYRKDKSPHRDKKEARPRVEEAEVHADPTWDEDIPPAVYPEGFGFDDTVYRVDPCHPGQVTDNLRPHIQFAPAGGLADPAFVSLYHRPPGEKSDESPADDAAPAESQAEQAAAQSLPSADPVAEAPEPPSVSPPSVRVAEPTLEDGAEQTVSESVEQAAEEISAKDQPEDPSPPQDATEVLREAAAVQLPPTLQLPSVFGVPDDDHSLDTEAGEITPEWEVDRFVWPAICERLLDTQSRYFSHVGQRLLAATEENHHVIMISGSRRGEGRTTLAMCLARCATAAGVEVALVDADLQNPKLGSRLGMETPCSWLEALAGKATLNEVAVSSVEDRLTLIPLAGSEHAYISTGDRKLISLIRKISAHFPLVIIDVGPVTSHCSHLFEGGEVCPVDTAIVVRDLRKTTEEEAMATAKGLQCSGIQAVGVAENFRAA